MEWVTGVKLTTLPPAEVRELVRVGQEAFLTQLLDVGFFHGGECSYLVEPGLARGCVGGAGRPGGLPGAAGGCGLLPRR